VGVKGRLNIASPLKFAGRQHWPGVRLFAILLLASTAVPAGEQSAQGGDATSREVLRDVTDCRYLTSENPELAFDGRAPGGTWFPRGDLFRPPVADLRQPRFYLSPRRVDFSGDALPAGGGESTASFGIVGMGGDYGIWKRNRRRRCDGVQVNLMAGITSQFNLDADSDALVNTDFIIGPSVTLRRGRLSTRMRLYHQSSHLGDEFILENPGVDRVNLSFEVLDALVSYEWPWWRVYGGAGYLAGAQPDLDPTLLFLGAEFRSPKRHREAGLRPVAGIDINSLQERGWRLTTSLMGGIEMSNPDGTHRYRVLLSFLHGFMPFGQFFTAQRLQGWGLTLQFDF